MDLKPHGSCSKRCNMIAMQDIKLTCMHFKTCNKHMHHVLGLFTNDIIVYNETYDYNTLTGPPLQYPPEGLCLQHLASHR